MYFCSVILGSMGSSTCKATNWLVVLCLFTVLVYLTPNLKTLTLTSMAVQSHSIGDNASEEQESLTKISASSATLPNIYVPSVLVDEVMCSAIIDGNKNEITQAKNVKHSRMLHNQQLQAVVKECSSFKKQRHYITEPISAEEAAFPIAFSILMYKDVGQVERLLRAIYRPQNFYCIHIDKKSTDAVYDAMHSITNCFPNVFMAPRRVSVIWGQFSVLQPEIVCMEALWNYTAWRYFINLTGQEFPLKTNLQLVKILKAFNGANGIAGIPWNMIKQRGVKERIHYRFHHHLIKAGRKSPFPHPVNFFKGQLHIAASRGYVGFLLHDPVARELLEWSVDTAFPDELVFSTLQHNPQLGVPGSYTGGNITSRAGSVTRYKVWDSQKLECHGKYVRLICIIGVGDLHLLAESKQMFVNKLHADYQPLAYDCLEELHFNRTRADALQPDRTFNTTYYEELPFVKYANRVDSLVN